MDEHDSMNSDPLPAAEPAASAAGGESTISDPRQSAERRREYGRRYREANKDKIAEYRRRYKTERREHYLELHREQTARAAKRRERVAHRRERKHAYYVDHRDTILPKHRERARAYIDRKMSEDPVAFRAHRATLAREWRARNKEQMRELSKQRRAANPEKHRESVRRYRAAHPEKVKEANRRYYEANREKVLAANRRWKERERRRRDAGLPPRRLRSVSVAERTANQDAADAFFASAWAPERIAALRVERVTKAEITGLHRDNERARAIAYAVEHPELIDRLRRDDQPHAAYLARQRAEETRMDDIARQINDRLRAHPRTVHADPAAPHQTATDPTRQGPQR